MTRLACLAFVASLLTACSVTETGNPNFSAELGITARTSDPEKVGIGVDAGRVVVDHFWVAIHDIGFASGAACDAPGATPQLPGPLAIDLASPTASSTELGLDAGAYCRFGARIAAADAMLPVGAPSELADHALAIEGHREDGTPFVLRSRTALVIDIDRRAMPFTIDDAMPAILLAVDVAECFHDVDFEGSTPGPDGRIDLADPTNAPALERFEANLAGSFALYRDADADGDLDDDEHEVGDE